MLARPRAPEIDRLETAFAEAHGGGNGYAFASAPLACSALLDLLDSGAHVLVPKGLEADNYRMIEGIRRRSAGLRVEFVDMADLSAVERAATQDTRLLWVECLAGPRLSNPDLAALASFARERDIYVAADVTSLTHAIARPIADGCHIVFSAAPGRALGRGDADARGGLVTFAANSGFAEDRFAFLQKAYDAFPEPGQAAAMTAALEGIPQEMAARSACARDLAERLAGEGYVEEAIYPGEGGDVSLILKGPAGEVAAALGRLKRFSAGTSAGLPGTFWHYARRSYEAVPDEIRSALGIPDGLVRFGIPAAASEDLLGDFRAAFG